MTEEMEYVRVCPACQRANPADVEECLNCDEPLTTVSRVLKRHEPSPPPRFLDQARSRAAQIKADEEQASQARMERFQKMDRQRLQALREASLEQQVKDRKLLLITSSLLGALIVALLITSLVILLRG